MLKFKNFSMNGAFSYGKANINFSPGLILLEGKNLDEGSNVSNMAGKSSIFKGITTVLFEQNSEDQIKDDLVNVNGHKADLNLQFDVMGKEIELRYIRENGKGDWRIWENGNEMTRSMNEMKKYIPSLIGMDYNMFVAGSYLEQGRISKFIEVSSIERMSLICKYFGLDRASILRDKVKEVKRTVQEDLIRADSKIKQLEEIKFVDNIEEKIREINTLVQKDTPIAEEEFLKHLSQFEKKIKFKNEYLGIDKILEDNKTKLSQVEGIIYWADDILKKVVDDKCYVCGSKLNSKEFRKDVEHKLSEATLLKKSTKQELDRLKTIWLECQFDEKREKEKLDEMKKKVGDKQDYLLKIQELGALKKQRDIQNKIDVDLVDLKKEKNGLLEMFEILDFWYDGFSFKGIPLMVLDKLLVGLNKCFKLYGDKLERNVSCIIDGDKLILDVKDKWKNIKIGYLSGSEKMLVSLIIALGMWHWLSLRGRGTNVLFLDEVLAPFDSTMRVKVIELLKDIAQDRCVVLVTHNEDIKSMIDWSKIWLVEKKNGLSNLQVY